MEAKLLEKSPVGRLVPIEPGPWAFVPTPLPRHLDLSSSLIFRLDEASRAVATLAGVGETIPNPNLLVAPFMRREAVFSSQIEGTQASLADLFRHEALEERQRSIEDLREVANYVRALNTGLERVKTLPISLRLVNEVHSRLLEGVRGEDKRPGELRTTQVWVGAPGTPIQEARYVPPPAHLLRGLFLDWEQFMNDDLQMPPLIRCALMHYQFETIHPYTDGNGRVGRLLIILFLCAAQVLPTPLLYLSAYFERDRNLYEDQLFRVSATGNWGGWIDYFLKGVAEQARDALARTRQIRDLQERYRHLLQERQESANAFRVVEALFAQPYVTAPMARRLLNVTSVGASGILKRLTRAGILELVPNQWPRLYLARDLLELLQAPKASQ